MVICLFKIQREFVVDLIVLFLENLASHWTLSNTYIVFDRFNDFDLIAINEKNSDSQRHIIENEIENCITLDTDGG